MNSRSKGKAVIISIALFEVVWLRDLVGYNRDVEKLADMWNQMGFDVYIPTTDVKTRDLTTSVRRLFFLYVNNYIIKFSTLVLSLLFYHDCRRYGQRWKDLQAC